MLTTNATAKPTAIVLPNIDEISLAIDELPEELVLKSIIELFV